MDALRTIQCESFGNPETAAGPKARAVFMAAPVYGTANLKFRCIRKSVIPCYETPAPAGISTYRWQANSVRPTPICFRVRGREETEIVSLGRVRKEITCDEERKQTRTGAKGVELCFSAASMSTARQSAAVMNISMKTP